MSTDAPDDETFTDDTPDHTYGAEPGAPKSDDDMVIVISGGRKYHTSEDCRYYKRSTKPNRDCTRGEAKDWNYEECSSRQCGDSISKPSGKPDGKEHVQNAIRNQACWEEDDE